MFFTKRSLLVLSCTFVLAACEKASDTVISIPSVQVQCLTSDSANCNSGNPGISAVVIMSRSGCDDNSIDFESVATGSTTMTCDTGGCIGTISSWTNPDNQNSVTEILTGRMDLCSTIDINSSGGDPDTGDLVDDSSRSISSSATITVDTWEEI